MVAQSKTLANQLGVTVKDELALFHELCDELRKWNIVSVAEEAEMCNTTLYNWINGVSIGRFQNVIKVGRVLGMELQWVRDSGGSKKPSLSVVK